MSRHTSIRVDPAQPVESIADWQLRLDLEAREREINASIGRQRRAMHAWQLDHIVHRGLQLIWWAAVAAVIVLAVVGLNVVLRVVR